MSKETRKNDLNEVQAIVRGAGTSQKIMKHRNFLIVPRSTPMIPGMERFRLVNDHMVKGTGFKEVLKGMLADNKQNPKVFVLTQGQKEKFAEFNPEFPDFVVKALEAAKAGEAKAESEAAEELKKAEAKAKEEKKAEAKAKKEAEAKAKEEADAKKDK